MKLLRTLTLLLTGLLFTLSASAQKATEPVAYRLVDSVGRPVTFDKLITRAAGADVVFFGELHNNPISHWMQLRVLEALQQRKGKNLTLGLEMLEADIQLILDEYLAKTISPKSYGDEARLWPNYETDYDPVVYFAKDHGLRVIATNVPRRYAPKTRIVTITTVLQEDVQSLEEAYRSMADFILIVPEDMTRTH